MRSKTLWVTIILALMSGLVSCERNVSYTPTMVPTALPTTTETDEIVTSISTPTVITETAPPTPTASMCSAETVPDVIELTMATSWPEKWPESDEVAILYSQAQLFAKLVEEETQGKVIVSIYENVEKDIAFDEVLGAVQAGNKVQMGHTASYYYISQGAATAFGSTLPFGLTAEQQHQWLYEGNGPDTETGLDMLQQYYKDNFGIIQYPVGSTGMQMGGWYRKEIATVDDLRGLKMRIPGLGGLVMSKLGATVLLLGGDQIKSELQSGRIDAAEWIGPHDDFDMGLHEAVKGVDGEGSGYYYYPGWWEPGLNLEVQINLDCWEGMLKEHQGAIESAARQLNELVQIDDEIVPMFVEYDEKNSIALKKLEAFDDIDIRPFSEDILDAARDASLVLYDELAQEDPDFAEIYESWNAYRERVQATPISYESKFEYRWLNERHYVNYLSGQLGQGE